VQRAGQSVSPPRCNLYAVPAYPFPFPSVDPTDYSEFLKVNQDLTQLHPDLQPYVQTDELFGCCLKHPLVFAIPITNVTLCNRSYEQKSARYQKYVENREWESALFFLERPYRLERLHDWWSEDEITLQELREVLPTVWADTEYPEQFGEMPLELFEAAGYCSDSETRLEGVLTLYRGAHSAEIGMEWSLSLETAKFFANRFAGKQDRRFVAKCQIDAARIFAYITCRGEEEVIVPLDEIADVEMFELVGDQLLPVK
jgi:hypothetical protein